MSWAPQVGAGFQDRAQCLEEGTKERKREADRVPGLRFGTHKKGVRVY
jgi:hypothetical protein